MAQRLFAPPAPPPKKHVYPHPMICSHLVANVAFSGYTCTPILYPGTQNVPTHCSLERSRRRGRSARGGTFCVSGYKTRVHMFPCVPQRCGMLASSTFYSAPCSPTSIFGGTVVPNVPGSQRNIPTCVLVHAASSACVACQAGCPLCKKKSKNVQMLLKMILCVCFFFVVLCPCALAFSKNLQSYPKLPNDTRARKEKYCPQKCVKLENLVTKEPSFKQRFLRIL